MKNRLAGKIRLRKALKERIKAISRETAEEEGERIAEIITELPQWKNSRNILLFFSMKGKEIDTSPIIRRGGLGEGETRFGFSPGDCLPGGNLISFLFPNHLVDRKKANSQGNLGNRQFL